MEDIAEFAVQQQNVRVFRMDSEEYKTVSYNRRDYYKIAFVTEGTGLMHFGHPRAGRQAVFIIFQSVDELCMGANI